MARGRSTSRARSASSSRTKRAASTPTKIFGIKLSAKKIIAVASEIFAVAATVYATMLAFRAGNRPASLGYGALAVSAVAVLLNRLVGCLSLPKKIEKAIANFEHLWTYYMGYFGAPLIGYTTLVSLGVVGKVCTTSYMSAACTGGGDLVDYLAALFVIFVVSSSVAQVGKFVTVEVIHTATHGLPVVVAAVLGQQRPLAAVASAFIVLTLFSSLIEKQVPAFRKYALLLMATNAAHAGMAVLAFKAVE